MKKTKKKSSFFLIVTVLTVIALVLISIQVIFYSIKNKDEKSSSSITRTAAESYIDDTFQNISKNSISTVDGKSILVLDDITPLDYNIITQNEVLMNILEEKYGVEDLTLTVSGKAIRESLYDGTSDD